MNTKKTYPSRRSLTYSLSEPVIIPSLRWRSAAYTHSSVISVAVVTLLKELEGALDPPCLAIARTAWSQLNLVSGPSKNVIDLIQAVEHVVQAVKDRIERPKYTRNFLDKAVRFVLFTSNPGLVSDPPPKPDLGQIYTRPREEPTTQGDRGRTGESHNGRRST